MNYNLLNNMIDYIEENLTEDIEYSKLARIVGVSVYSLQRIFMFITGISISEYIRKRRLSKSFEELKTSDIKIIDLALKYNYDSSISFSRAFKQYFGITPTECRKSESFYKSFPVMNFNNINDDNYVNYDVNYEIKDIEQKVLYCFSVTDTMPDDLLFKIRELYKDLEDKGIYSKFNESGMYGIYVNEEKYYVGSEIPINNTEKVVVEAGKYAIFEVGSDEQKDIVRVYNFVHDRWLKSTNYEILDNQEIEVYVKDNCYMYFRIKDKQI